MSSSQQKNVEPLEVVKKNNDIDFDKVDKKRGKTPNDIVEKCLRLCKDYLANNWMEQTSQTIEVQRLSGGLTNQLYYCRIREPSSSSDAPQEVVVRLYGTKHMNNSECGQNERLTDVVIGLVVSENGLGPKVYGIFEEGQIQQYYKHRLFRIEEQNEPSLVDELFKKLARVHGMEVPIKKSHWLFTEFDKFMTQTEKHLDNGLREIISQGDYPILLKHKLGEEVRWLKNMIVESGCPMVFSHNDFRSSNIMVLDQTENETSGNQIVLCDFEYASYGYRGEDFGSIINEWGRTKRGVQTFPDESILRQLVGIYVEESIRLLGNSWFNQEINSVDHIVKEFKLFSLSNNLFCALWCLRDEDDLDGSLPISKSDALQIAENLLNDYNRLKKQFIRENVFDF